ncbi:hypothetical protein Pint_08065 [Pistacia integerrima]|uniref:Uncharacterized protein n=1 Tax=Pistacia integerrima TaxID=434235 RepID=A0ACC0XSG6_9ROSI|nr:hypothetical protein Pint_08065 [Pistacia integerrima]
MVYGVDGGSVRTTVVGSDDGVHVGEVMVIVGTLDTCVGDGGTFRTTVVVITVSMLVMVMATVMVTEGTLVLGMAVLMPVMETSLMVVTATALMVDTGGGDDNIVDGGDVRIGATVDGGDMAWRSVLIMAAGHRWW